MTPPVPAVPGPDTICALSSPPGRGERAVVRLSGPRARRIVRAIVRPAPELTVRAVHEGELDDGIGTQPVRVLWMPAPHSFTREDVCELHLPGAPPLVDAALTRLYAAGARPAEPGEFTRRAFANGRIDLTRAEGVLALALATTDAERRSAAALLFGGLDRRVGELRGQLEELRALVEASLDFDESDTGHVPTEELAHLADRARDALAEAGAWEARREPLGELPRIALVGPANAGKSSLFNRLVGADQALVRDFAGTTRDGVAGLWHLGGVACRLVDTAGWLDRSTAPAGALDPDEEARVLAEAEGLAADLAILVVDGPSTDPEALDRLVAALPEGPARILAWNQADRGGAPPEGRPAGVAGADRVAVSALDGRGLDRLAERARVLLGLGAPGSPGEPGDDAGGPRLGRELSLRHRAALGAARRALEEARAGLAGGAPLDLVAETLRAATDALDGISGRTTPEDLLDRIFARFCLGK